MLQSLSILALESHPSCSNPGLGSSQCHQIFHHRQLHILHAAVDSLALGSHCSASSKQVLHVIDYNLKFTLANAVSLLQRMRYHSYAACMQ